MQSAIWSQIELNIMKFTQTKYSNFKVTVRELEFECIAISDYKRIEDTALREAINNIECYRATLSWCQSQLMGLNDFNLLSTHHLFMFAARIVGIYGGLLPSILHAVLNWILRLLFEKATVNSWFTVLKATRRALQQVYNKRKTTNKQTKSDID